MFFSKIAVRRYKDSGNKMIGIDTGTDLYSFEIPGIRSIQVTPIDASPETFTLSISRTGPNDTQTTSLIGVFRNRKIAEKVRIKISRTLTDPFIWWRRILYIAAGLFVFSTITSLGTSASMPSYAVGQFSGHPPTEGFNPSIPAPQIKIPELDCNKK